MADSNTSEGGFLLELEGFRVESELGAGPWGPTYLAEQLSSGQRRAIKHLILPSNEPPSAYGRRFKILARLSRQEPHPNIVRIEDLIENESGLPCVVMEYVEGKTLRALYSKRHRPNPRELAKLVLELAEGLRFAHSHGLIHGLLEPRRVLLAEKDYEPKIADFGQHLAEIDPTDSPPSLKESRRFAAPELLETDTTPTEETDVYGYGAVVYWILTGEAPCRPGQSHAAPHAYLTKRLLERSTVSRSMQEVVLHCLEPSPARRYRSIIELIEDLLRVGHGKTPHLSDSGDDPPVVRAPKSLPIIPNLDAMEAVMVGVRDWPGLEASVRKDSDEGPMIDTDPNLLSSAEEEDDEVAREHEDEPAGVDSVPRAPRGRSGLIALLVCVGIVSAGGFWMARSTPESEDASSTQPSASKSADPIPSDTPAAADPAVAGAPASVSLSEPSQRHTLSANEVTRAHLGQFHWVEGEVLGLMPPTTNRARYRVWLIDGDASRRLQLIYWADVAAALTDEQTIQKSDRVLVGGIIQAYRGQLQIRLRSPHNLRRISRPKSD